jgi:hypothetical protein
MGHKDTERPKIWTKNFNMQQGKEKHTQFYEKDQLVNGNDKKIPQRINKMIKKSPERNK